MARCCTVTAADSTVDKYRHTCPHVLLLLYVYDKTAAKVEEACDSESDNPICLQVRMWARVLQHP